MGAEITVNGVKIECVEGDIAVQKTDAVVNAANSELWMGSGVAGAIKRTGGQEIQDEAVAKGPIAVGEAVVTGAGELAARYVIHAAGMGSDLRTSAELIELSTRNSLARAEELGIESISFPSIGTGVGGFPLDECARIMIDQTEQHAKSGSAVKLIRFVLFGSEAYSAFAQELRSRASTEQ